MCVRRVIVLWTKWWTSIAIKVGFWGAVEHVEVDLNKVCGTSYLSHRLPGPSETFRNARPSAHTARNALLLFSVLSIKAAWHQDHQPTSESRPGLTHEEKPCTRAAAAP